MSIYRSVAGKDAPLRERFGWDLLERIGPFRVVWKAFDPLPFRYYPTLTWLGVLSALVGSWWASLSVVNVRNMGELGLLLVLPISIYLVYVGLTISFCLAVRYQPPRPILLLHLLILVLMIHGTPHLLYGTVRYSWAWKHVGIIDYIQEFGHVDRANAILGAYHNWPGFFTANALLTKLAGLESSSSYAGWAPVVFNLLDLGALFLIFRACTRDERIVWLASWFFVLANWVGQDYFSPQAMNFFLHLVVLACVLRWFRQTTLPTREKLRRFLFSSWLADRVYDIFCRVQVTEPILPRSAPQLRIGIAILSTLLLATIASSHQLTPFMTLLGITMLVIFQRSNARWLPVIAFILTVAWLASGASIFMKDAIGDLISEAAQVSETLDTGFISLGEASYGQQLIALMGRALTAGFWAMALLGTLRRLYNGMWDLSALLLAGSPLLMMVGGSYGGEILFRIYFFTLPLMAFLAACLFFPTLASGRSWFTTIVAVVVSLAMLVGLGFAYYGKDQQYYFTPEEIAATTYLESVAPPGSLIVEGTKNYPLRFRSHTLNTQYVAIAREPEDSLKEMLADPEEVFLRWMSNDAFPASFMIITRSMKAEINMIGDMPPGSLDMIEDVLMNSPQFDVIYANRDATVFVAVESQEIPDPVGSFYSNGGLEP